MKQDSITVIIADGLDASADGRGWGKEHQDASRLADAAPELLEALKGLVTACSLLRGPGRGLTKHQTTEAQTAITKATKG